MKGLWRLGTHDGSFHADEALAVWMMKRLHKELSVTRSRDPAVWEKLDMLVDVGDVYDPARHRFDHHQRGFQETFSERHSTKLSSAGLIFKHFGRDVLQTLDVSPEHLEVGFPPHDLASGWLTHLSRPCMSACILISLRGWTA